MPPAVARTVAAAFGALAFALHLMVTFRIEPMTWRAHSRVLGLGVFTISMAAPVIICFGGYLLITRPLRHPPAVFTVDARRRRFVAPASPVHAGSTAIMGMWFAGGAILTERAPDPDRVRIARFAGAVPVSVAVVALFLALAVLFLVIRRPWVALDPAGLTVQRLRHRTTIAWGDLAPGGPPPPAGRRPQTLWVYRDTPVGAPFDGVGLPVGRLHVDPAFLAAAIHHYVAHPGHRPAIGTAAEQARLCSAVAEASPAVPMITPRSA